MGIPHSSLLRGVSAVLKEQAKILDRAATLLENTENWSRVWNRRLENWEARVDIGGPLRRHDPESDLPAPRHAGPGGWRAAA